MRGFAQVRTWVFDLDNTLYPPSARLFDQISARMEAWIVGRLGVDAAEAGRIRARFWKSHGTTLAGLMAEHGIDPWDFLADVHAVDMSGLEPAPELAELIRSLPGRRIVHTNADSPYAGRVLAARGLDGVFDAVYGIEHAGWRPKPGRASYDAVFAADGVVPSEAAMFEDDLRNLAEPHAMGMLTVAVAPDPPGPAEAAHVDCHTDDLAGFLAGLAAGSVPGSRSPGGHA